MIVQPGLCRTWSETPKTGFLTTRLIYNRFASLIGPRETMNRIINDTHSSIFAPDYSKFVTLTVVLTLCLFSISLNSLLIYCIVAKRNQAWAKNAKQVFYLILSDLLVSVLMVPRLIFEPSVGRKPYTFCAVSMFIVMSTQLVSYCHVLALCIHRYMVIRKAHLPSQIDRTRYGIQSLVIWVMMLFASVPPFVFGGKHGEVLFDCRLWYTFGPTDKGAVTYVLVSFCVPWILTNAVYMAISIRVQRMGRVHPSESIRLASFRSVGTAVESCNLINQKITSANQVAANQLAISPNQVATNQLEATTSVNQAASKELTATASANQLDRNQQVTTTSTNEVATNRQAVTTSTNQLASNQQAATTSTNEVARNLQA